MCIVTGPRIELAITLIEGLKGLFQSEQNLFQREKILTKTSIFDSKETVIELNGVQIEAFQKQN